MIFINSFHLKFYTIGLKILWSKVEKEAFKSIANTDTPQNHFPSFF